MDKAIIFGVFEFLGFHFCTKLLEQGYEVEGVHFAELETDEFIDEKRLAIGRNSNFTEIDSAKFQPNSTWPDDQLIIVDYYDFYMRNETSRFETFSQLDFFFEHKKKSKVMNLLPIQWLLEEVSLSFPNCIPSYHIYFPTIYGPWQQSTFIFQQALLKKIQKNAELFLHDREWTHDAIYIDDAVNRSLEILKKKTASYLLKSDLDNHWQKCGDYLSLPLSEFALHPKQLLNQSAEINEVIVRSETLFSEGIERQKRHLHFLS